MNTCDSAPPSSGMDAPEMNAAAGLARKMQVPAISSGFPKRPTGITDSILSPKRGSAGASTAKTIGS